MLVLFPVVFFISSLWFTHYYFYSIAMGNSTHAQKITKCMYYFYVLLLSSFLYRNYDLYDQIGKENSIEFTVILLFSFGYTFYDLVYECVAVEKWNLDMILHHIVVIWACYGSLLHGRSGAEFVLGTLLCESTSPLLHIRYLFQEYQLQVMVHITDFLFATGFVYTRIYVAFSLVTTILVSENTIDEIKQAAVLLYTLNCIWCVVLYKVVYDKVVK